MIIQDRLLEIKAEYHMSVATIINEYLAKQKQNSKNIRPNNIAEIQERKLQDHAAIMDLAAREKTKKAEDDIIGQVNDQGTLLKTPSSSINFEPVKKFIQSKKKINKRRSPDRTSFTRKDYELAKATYLFEKQKGKYTYRMLEKDMNGILNKHKSYESYRRLITQPFQG